MAMNMTPAAAAGGTANRLDVWNMYNRVTVAAVCRDSTDSWNYTTATIRSANGNAANRINFVIGISEDPVIASYSALVGNGTDGTVTIAGVGLDATDAFSGRPSCVAQIVIQASSVVGLYNGLPGIGFHFLQALEYSVATGTSTWYGDNGAPTLYQNGLSVMVRA